MFSSPLHKDPRLPELYTLYKKKKEASERIRGLKRRIQATHDVLQLEELKCRKRVLRRLAFTTASDIVDVKGRVACEISSGDELLLTELIFNGAFNSLLPEQCAAILSCFVFTEKVGCSPLVIWTDRLDSGYIERASYQTQGRTRYSITCYARDCKADRQGIQGIQTCH